MKAPINRIIAFSNVDGPGNRMAIFFQRCPFKCLYCHNPETINDCIHCGVCVKHCPVDALSMVDGKVMWDKKRCVSCDTCLKVCPNLSTPKITYYDEDELFKMVAEEQDFISGITVSGGECMEHAAYLTGLFAKVKTLGKTCFIDSNGDHLFANYPELCALMDMVMLDVKAFEPIDHQNLCGKDNQRVLENLAYLQKINKLYEVRTVMLPNNPALNERTLRGTIAHLAPHIRYKLIKYRPFGVRQAGLEKLGNTITSDEEIQRLAQIARELGHENVVIV
ncbi:MAG: YjjW family glycine radical enzyme activase [Erysipelotrichaceae bacterium]|nr:YjjW family glycine radical enzyme activase [Erysipelotrichaceae bacterium]MDY5252677.1 YjjW family glycine radical enzyme activase [Erysipelotrichaceae bacterium]